MKEKKNDNISREIGSIVIKGARTHNLKNITLEIPRNSLTVFTGLSGSGKSSLAFDTIFAEGQRRYVESLSSYARQFLRQMQKPDVDEITGLSPAISIDQKSRSNNPRSTVATITEIYDYLRILYARIGRPHCLICGDEIRKLSNEEIRDFVMEKVDEVYTKFPKSQIEIFSPIVRGRKGEYYQLLYDFLGKGYSYALIDGVKKSLRERVVLTKTKKHEISVLVDAIDLKEFKKDEKNANERLAEAIEKAIHESEGLLLIRLKESEFLMSAKWACPKDGFSFPEIEPRLFSFNSPYGACPDCNGLGTKYFFGTEVCELCKGKRLRAEALNVLVGNKNIVELTALSIQEADEFFKKLKLTVRESNISKVVTKEIETRLSFMLNIGIEYLTLDRRAHTLSGGEAQRIRLASQLGSGLVGALYVLDEPTIGLHARDNERLIKTLLTLRDLGNTIIVVEHDEETIFSADYLVDIGPGAGVHGGEVVVAGWLDELLFANPPERPESSGRAGNNESKSLTLAYLRGEKRIELPEKRRNSEKGKIAIRAGKIFNIKHLNVDIPLGRLIAVTGVSGSGKSSFVYEILHKNLQARLERRYRSAQTFNCKSFEGSEYLGRSIMIDQSPIGRTPRSNPATYTGAFTFIRELFAETSEARARGWKASRFSFNVKGGRCETCNGNGMIEVEMHFLPTVYVLCDVCNGRRFMKETLEIKIKGNIITRPNDRGSSGRAGKSIYDVLEMTVEEALTFFEDIPSIYDRLKSLNDVGLGYLALGQSATTLSGGEAQRVKIASELYRPHLEKTIYLLDEPTIGLHYEDVKKLIEILQKLVDKGNTVMVIEHNLDFIKCSDYILDIGPDAGASGGDLVASGTPEEVANTDTHTGKYLRKILRKK